MNLNKYSRKSGSRAPTKKAAGGEKKLVDRKPKLADFIRRRDYQGAVILLEFERQTGNSNPLTLPWLGFAAFHLGDYKKALDVYTELLATEASPNPEYHLYAACCHFYMGNFEKANAAAKKGPGTSRLRARLFFHLAHKTGDEKKLVAYHQQMTDAAEDQLSMASIHYAQNQFQEATDIYRRLVKDYRDYLALQVYVALCYYKLDYYDVSLEFLAPYLQKHPDSAIAINLKACSHYKLYDGKAAEAELKALTEVISSSSQNVENDLVRHNLVVFRNGENALQVLPPLLDLIPEARLNLVIFHLRCNEVMEAYELIKDLTPKTPQEFTLKGVVNAAIGQLNNSPTHLKEAQKCFHLVGGSKSECDTIPGRQCMASCFFLLKQFDDVLIYLNSVKAYANSDPIFLYNYGITLAATDKWQEAEEVLLMVQSEEIQRDYAYVSWLARTLIMNGKPRQAWDMYLKMESNADSFSMLVLIANDCYKVGSFYYAAKAFDVLERLDPSPEFWEGKRGACCGVFQQVIAREEKKEHLHDVISMLGSNANTPQAEFIIRIMSKWASENGMN